MAPPRTIRESEPLQADSETQIAPQPATTLAPVPTMTPPATPTRGSFGHPLFETEAVRGLERVGVCGVASDRARMGVFYVRFFLENMRKDAEAAARAGK